MALLVMRVSGDSYGDKFFPQIAGVGFSFNPYVWHKDIDPHAGVVRLVFGLGTRAVDRADDDYTRLVALNAPARRPESNFDEVCEYSQRRVDYLDIAANRFASGHFLDLIRENPDLPLEMVASQDESARQDQGAESRADLRRPALDYALRRGHAHDAHNLGRRLPESGGHRVHRELRGRRTATRSTCSSAARSRCRVRTS